MYARIFAGVVFAGVLFAAVTVWAMLQMLSEVRRGELAERLGAGHDIPQLLRARQMDTVGVLLGPVGRWLHNLRLRAGERGTVAELLVVVGLLAGVTPLLLSAVLDGPVVWLGVLAGAAPILLLMARAAARSRRLSAQLSDALDIVARALRAGHAFTDALRMAAAELPAPIGEELAQTAEEHRLGLELRECLTGLVERVPESFDVRLFVGAVLLNRDTGGNLIEVLENMAETIRDRVVFEGKVRALTAEVRTSAAILASLPFLAAVALAAVQPDYLSPLLQPGLGRTLLTAGVVSMGLGVLVMRRLSQVEV
jgi:tight adherence protein B